MRQGTVHLILEEIDDSESRVFKKAARLEMQRQEHLLFPAIS